MGCKLGEIQRKKIYYVIYLINVIYIILKLEEKQADIMKNNFSLSLYTALKIN